MGSYRTLNGYSVILSLGLPDRPPITARDAVRRAYSLLRGVRARIQRSPKRRRAIWLPQRRPPLSALAATAAAAAKAGKAPQGFCSAPGRIRRGRSGCSPGGDTV